MELDPRQFLLLIIAFAVPVVAFLLNRPRVILGWVGFTLFVQIFDTTILTNLPAGRLVGLLFLPSVVTLFRQWIRLPSARAWLINFFYMVALGLIFGFVMPWPDISGIRPFPLRAPGRTIIFVLRTVSDLSLAMFVMNQLTQPGAFETLRKWMVRGAVVSSLFAFATRIIHVDFYTLITGLRAYAAMDTARPRGLTFEPRGLGQACAYGMILILGKQVRRPYEWVLLLVIAGGLAVSSSTSGLGAALAGLFVIALIGSMRVRLALIGSAILVLVVGTAVVWLSPAILNRSRSEIALRLQGRGVTESNRVTNFGEAIAYRLDVFDASAVLFLLHSPIYAVIGTGPGLMSLPASDHIPAGMYKILFPVIDTPPTHGILLELSNTGIVGVTTWIFMVSSIFFAGRRLVGRRGLPFPPKTATTLFVAAAALYTVQVGPSPFWAVFLGLGWAIAQIQLVPEGVAVKRSCRQREAATLATTAARN